MRPVKQPLQFAAMLQLAQNDAKHGAWDQTSTSNKPSAIKPPLSDKYMPRGKHCGAVGQRGFLFVLQ